MKHLFKCILLLILLIGFLSSCKKLVEVEIPNSLLLSGDLFENGKSAESALAGVYIHLRAYGFLTAAGFYGTVDKLGLYTDELKYLPQNTSDEYQFYNYYVLSTNARIKDYWSYPYQTIFLTNSILEAEKEALNINQEMKDRLKGEALFVRALCHFYLTNTFGDIPYVTSINYKETNLQGKLPVSKIYELVLQDLIIAEGLLKDAYPIAERLRPNKWVVKSLLARVYLYNQDWKNAELKSSEVIGNTSLYAIENDLSKVFLKDSKETIWQSRPVFDAGNTEEAQRFILNQDPNNGGYVATDEFLNAHEPGDQRKVKWLSTYTLGANKWIHAYKYKQKNATGTAGVEYSILFRLAEQYLIRSEAYARQNMLDMALADLNKIRSRANLEKFESTSKDEILDAILKERRIELYLEHGHRFYDLKRTGKAEQYLKPIKKGWTADHLLWPLPSTELEANRNLLPQNKGYNQ